MYIAFLEVLHTDGSRESYFRWVQFFGGHLASLCIAATPRTRRSPSLGIWLCGKIMQIGPDSTWRKEKKKRGRGPFTYDVRTEGVGGLAKKQAIVLIGCVSGTVTRGRG